MYRMNLIWKHDLLWVNLVDRIRNTFWANVSYFLYNEIYTLVCLKKLLLIMPCKRKMLLDKMIFMASFTKLPEWWVMKFWRVNAIWRDIFQVVYEMSDLASSNDVSILKKRLKWWLRVTHALNLIPQTRKNELKALLFCIKYIQSYQIVLLIT